MNPLRLQTLRMRDFRCFKDTTLHFDRFTFIVGENRTGKSSIVDAIELGLAGRCIRGTDAAGRNAKQLLRGYGTDPSIKAFYIDIEFRRGDDPVKISRRTTVSGTSSVEGELTINPGLLRILCEGTALLNPKVMAEAEATTVITQALERPVIIDEQDVTIGRARELLKEAELARRDANRDVANLHVPEAPEGPAPPEDLEARVDQLRKREQELVIEQHEATAVDRGRAAELRRQHQVVCDRVRLAKQRFDTFQETCPADLGVQVALLEKAIAENRYDSKAVAAEQAFLEQAAAPLAQLQHDVAQLEVMGKAKGKDRKCGYCDEIPCHTNVTLFTAKYQFRQTELEKAEQRHATSQQRLDDLKAAVRAKSEQEKQLAELKAKQAKQTQLLTAVEEADEQEAKVRAELEAAEAQPTESVVEHKELSEIRARLERGQQALVRAAQWRAQAAAREQGLVDKAAAEKRAYDCDARVQAINQAIDTVSVQALAKLSHDVSANMLALNEPPMEFRLNPTWQVLVGGVPSILLSESEQIRAGIALQMAIADITGLGFIVVDRVDHFDKKTLRAFYALVQRWHGQVVILMTKSDDDDKVPSGQGITAYRLVRDLAQRGPSDAVHLATGVAA